MCPGWSPDSTILPLSPPPSLPTISATLFHESPPVPPHQRRALRGFRPPQLRRGFCRPAQARRPDRLRLVRQDAICSASSRSRRWKWSRCAMSIKRCSPTPPSMVASGRPRKKKPRTYGDYREMLEEKDLDVVLVATPDHWHALPMIAAVKSGADVYCQKPTSVDVVESQAMLAAARKYGRVVQIGTQRRSTPHLIEAREQIIKAGKLGKVGLVEICCYYHMRATDNPPDTAPPENLDYEMWTGPAPMRPVQSARPSAPLARFHGIRQRHRRRHVRPHARHDALDARSRLAHARQLHAAASSSTRRARRTSPTRKPRRSSSTICAWSGRTAPGATRPIRSIRGPRPSTATRARSRRASWATISSPQRQGRQPIHRDVTYELEQYPEDKTEKDLEKHCAPAIRGHMKDFLAAIAQRAKPGGRHRARRHLDDLLHPRESLDEARPHAHLGRRGRQDRRRRRSEPPARAPLSRAVGASDGGDGLTLAVASHGVGSSLLGGPDSVLARSVCSLLSCRPRPTPFVPSARFSRRYRRSRSAGCRRARRESTSRPLAAALETRQWPARLGVAGLHAVAERRSCAARWLVFSKAVTRPSG